MRIASETDLALAVARFAESGLRLANYRQDMLDDPVAGRSLRHYIILTECPELLVATGLSVTERFWSRYYWLARSTREWQAYFGYDAGLEQQLFQLLESEEAASMDVDPLPEVEAAAERDAVLRSRR